MAALLIARRNRANYRERVSWRLRDAQNPFELREKDFVYRFKLSRDATMEVIREFRPYVTLGHNGYSLEVYVLNTLSIFGSGSFQRITADSFWGVMTQASLSRGMSKILEGFMSLIPKYIKFPRTREEIQATKCNFFTDLGFPNTIGAIDCTHIQLKRPAGSDWFVYINRKNTFSINTQMVCNSKMEITDVVARWPGCTHDARIWHLSGLKHLMENMGQGLNFLLGDSGYPLQPWLLTPYLDAENPMEEIFNKKHVTARNIIERCFGVLKSRFRILDKSGGIMCYSPEKVCRIIIACVILHNICIKYKLADPEIIVQPDDDDEIFDEDDYMNIHPSQIIAARRIRDQMAAHFQTRR